MGDRVQAQRVGSLVAVMMYQGRRRREGGWRPHVGSSVGRRRNLVKWRRAVAKETLARIYGAAEEGGRR